MNETLVVITDYGSYILFYILNLANSEGVQNWTYQLVENGEMSLLYGKSYLQAFINMFVLRVFQGETISSWQAVIILKTLHILMLIIKDGILHLLQKLYKTLALHIPLSVFYF